MKSIVREFILLALQFRLDKIKKYENQIKKLDLNSWKSLNQNPKSITEYILA